MPRRRWYMAAGLLLVVALGVVNGGEPVAQPGATGPVISCQPAGPPPVAWWAIPGRTKADTGCYVGGGGNRGHGEARFIDEGTWGWDYQGYFNFRKIWLSWNHGRLDQGGQGAYRTDGHPVFNIFANPPAQRGDEH